jgi:uncharacterized membrane protein
MTPLTKRLAVGLAISVAVNLLLAGIFVGFAVQHRTHAAARPAESAFGPPRAGQARFGRSMRRALGEHRPELRERRQKAAAARDAVRSALEQEPFDQQALVRALEGLRKETAESQELAHRTLLATAASATAAERKQLAAEFMQHGRGPRKMPHRGP